jgi:hypothetical protein
VGDVDPGAADDLRARQLRALAGDIETVADAALKAARSSEWECPNADDVRGKLGTYQTKARSAAADLRAEADKAERSARNKRTAATAAAGGS